jgi:hypothetical protein
LQLVLLDTASEKDDQQSHRRQEIASRARRSGRLRPAPEKRYRLYRKRVTMSMPWLLLSATAVGHDRSRRPAGDDIDHLLDQVPY